MGTKVLIVDDEEPIACLSAEILSIHGFETVTFFDPFEALMALDNQYFDLLLVDYRMPGLNGFQMIEMARRIQPHLTVVMMTGVGTMETALEALRRGADGLTLKPFTTKELVENIQYALNLHSKKQDGQRLQAIRPLFDVTEQLFSKTALVDLETFLVRAVSDLIPCAAVGLFDAPSVDDRDEVQLANQLNPDVPNILEEDVPDLRSKPGWLGLNFGGVTLYDSASSPQALLIAARLVIQSDPQVRTALGGPIEPTPTEPVNQLISKYQTELRQLGFGPYLGVVLAPHVFPQPDDEARFSETPTLPQAAIRESKLRVMVILREAGEIQFQQSEIETFLILCRQGAAALENATLTTDLNNTIVCLANSETTLRETIQRLNDSQRALLHAEKLATAGRLTASIAHEINNPLQSVQNCLHLAQRGELPLERRAGYMEMAEKELNRLMNIVSRMLKFYRPGQLDRKPTYLNQLLGNVLELTQNQLISQNIDLVTYFDPDLPAVMVVADQIQQVFMNLILNACQAMEGRPGCLTITTSVQGSPEFPPRKPLDRCSAQVNVDFTDTGSGLSEEALDRLFEPFYSTKEEGSGLGLSISYGIISAHGGEITVHNSSHGATFRVSLYTGECT